MNYNKYDPDKPSTWKNRFTMSELQEAGFIQKLLIILPIGIAGFVAIIFTFISLISAQSGDEGIIARILLARPIMIVFIPLGIVVLFISSLIYAALSANTLVKKIYLPSEEEYTLNLIKNKLLMPRASSPGFLNSLTNFPYLIIQSVEGVGKNHWAYWFGGPVLLIIYDGFAVYVERGNQFSRVLGAGLPPPVLERYERIRTVVDLRPIEKERNIEAWTKAGIIVKATVKIKVQILSS